MTTKVEMEHALHRCERRVVRGETLIAELLRAVDAGDSTGEQLALAALRVYMSRI